MTEDKNTEQKLDQFLKTHRPVAPRPAKDELDTILARVESEDKKVRNLWREIAIPVFAAACLLFMILIPDIRDHLKLNGTKVDENNIAIFLEETLGAIDNGNGFANADLTIGQDWLGLAE